MCVCVCCDIIIYQYRPEDRPTFAEIVVGIKDIFTVLSQEPTPVPARPPRPTPVPRPGQIPYRN